MCVCVCVCCARARACVCVVACVVACVVCVCVCEYLHMYSLCFVTQLMVGAISNISLLWYIGVVFVNFPTWNTL